MMLTDWITVIFLVAGGFFMLAGTMGLLRFPDLFSRLHALTKADNLGLGLIVAGLLFQADSLTVAAKLVFIWILALLASSSSCYLIGRHHLSNISDHDGKNRKKTGGL